MRYFIKIHNIISLYYLSIAGIYILLFLIGQLFSVQLVGDKDIYVNINGEYFENGYQGYFLFLKYNKVLVKDNINTKKIGDYLVEYRIPFLSFHKSNFRNIHVVDTEPPILEIVGSRYTYVKQHEEYREEGYKATDNIDGDLTETVKIQSDVDIHTIGNYTIQYTVEDSSKNKTTVTRKVEVINSDLLSGNIANFRLKGMFKDVILEYEEQEYDYLKDAIFIGDSNTLYLYQKGNYLPSNQIWGRLNMTITQINYSTFSTLINNQTVNLETAISTYHPKYLIVNLGSNTASRMDKNDMMRELDYLIEYVQKHHSSTKIIISSILPVREYGTDNGYASMLAINQHNYYTIQECHKYNVKFINFSDEIKNDKGYGDDSYLYCTKENDCGFHLSDEGKAKYIDYLKHLNFERD